ncbi:hypothetical protein EDD21DRAFT_370595 [Dissophora ornata]|nr:hypothetical protein EDD21DRAFT_370595 [Dissophora ornata]
MQQQAALAKQQQQQQQQQQMAAQQQALQQQALQQQQKNMVQLQMQQQQPQHHQHLQQQQQQQPGMQSPPFQQQAPVSVSSPQQFQKPLPQQQHQTPIPSQQQIPQQQQQQPQQQQQQQPQLGSPVPFNSHVRTNSVGSPHVAGVGGVAAPGVALGTPLEGSGLGLSGLNVNVNVADHGRLSPAQKEGAPTVLPPKAIELFAHNDKGHVLWFAGPPLDVVPLPKPHHSVEYLAKKQKLQNGNPHRTSLSKDATATHETNGIRASGTAMTNGENGVHGPGADEMLPVALQGLGGKPTLIASRVIDMKSR